MIIKIVTFFLVFIAALGMFGRLNVKDRARKLGVLCSDCGKLRMSGRPCDCPRKK